MTWYPISAISAASFVFIVGLIVYLKNIHGKLNQTFFLMNISIALWNIADFLLFFDLGIPNLFIVRCSYIGAFFIAPFFAKLNFLITESYKNSHKKLYYISIFTSIALLFILFSPLFIKNITINPYKEDVGKLYFIFILNFVVLVFYSLFHLAKYFFKTKSQIKKMQIKYIFLGLFIGVVAVLIYFVSLVNAEHDSIHFFIEMLYISIFTYAIFKYRIMDIDLVWRYALSYILYITAVSCIFITVAYFFKGNFLIIGVLVFATIVFTSYSYPWISAHLKPVILGKKYEYWQKLDKLAQDENSLYNSQNELYSLIKNIEKIMNLRNISLFMLKKEIKKFCLLKHVEEYNVNNGELAEITFNLENPLIKLLNSEKKVIFKEDLIARKEHKLLEKIDKLNVHVIFPLFSDDELSAVLFLGPKMNEAPFHGEDIGKLEGIIKIVERNLIADLVYKEKVSKVQDKYQRNLMEASKRMIELKDLDELTKHLMHIIMRTVNASKVGIYLHDIEKKAYIKKEVSGDNKDDLGNIESSIPEDNCLIEFLSERQDPITYNELENWASDTKIKYLQSVKEEVARLDVAIIIPIIFDNVLGFIGIGSKRDGTDYDENDWNTLNLLTYSAAMAIQNIVFAENVSKDSLTNLYNHGYFQGRLNECIASAIRNNQNLSCIILDIDHFKKYNDTYGHQQGDEILVKFSQYFKDNARPTDIVCRYGGEEFAAILPATDLEGAKIFSERVREGLENENILEAITISIGVASFKPDANEGKKHYRHDIDKIREKLIKSADKAVYQAKEEGRNRVILHEQVISSLEFSDTATKRLKILIVADSEKNYDVYKHYFQLKGYEILIAKTKDKAMTVLDMSKPDIILVDIDISSKNGEEILKNLAEIASVRIGALTEHGDYKSQLLNLGAKRVFIKPVDSEEIEDWIKRS